MSHLIALVLTLKAAVSARTAAISSRSPALAAPGPRLVATLPVTASLRSPATASAWDFPMPILFVRPAATAEVSQAKPTTGRTDRLRHRSNTDFLRR